MVSVSAQEHSRSIEDIKMEIELYKNQLKEQNVNAVQYSNLWQTKFYGTVDNISSIQDIIKNDKTLPLKEKIADLEMELSKAEGYTIDLDNTITMRNFGSSISRYNLEVGDILVFKPKPNAMLKFAPFWQGWQHAALVVEWNKIIEAVNFGKRSRYRSLDDVFSKQERSKYYEIAVIRIPHMSAEDKKKISQYAKEKLLNKLYPQNALMIPVTKYSMDYFYCSSLVWRAYMSWIKHIDLDSNYNWNWEHDIVWPADLLYNNNTIKYNLNF